MFFLKSAYNNYGQFTFLAGSNPVTGMGINIFRIIIFTKCKYCVTICETMSNKKAPNKTLLRLLTSTFENNFTFTILILKFPVPW